MILRMRGFIFFNVERDQVGLSRKIRAACFENLCNQYAVWDKWDFH